MTLLRGAGLLSGLLTVIALGGCSSAAQDASSNTVPLAKEVTLTSIEGLLHVGVTLQGYYHYIDTDGDSESGTQLVWLRDGQPIKGANQINYAVVAEDSGKKLQFRVTPAAGSGKSPGETVTSAERVIENSAPTVTLSALHVGVITPQSTDVGSELSIDIVYNDVDNDAPADPVIRWLRQKADKIDEIVIPNATGTAYTVISDDLNFYLVAEVIPVASQGVARGVAVRSQPILIAPNAIPVVQNLEVKASATPAMMGTKLTASYSYFDAEGDLDASALQWSNGSDIVGANGLEYILTPADAGKAVSVQVIPKSRTGTSPGTPVVSTPILVAANLAITSTPTIVAGYAHTCALSLVGEVQCWGRNDSGQLGNGSTTNSNTSVTITSTSGPVTALTPGDATVTGLGGRITALAAGNGHTCALNGAGAVQCWGWNVVGQLGNGDTIDSTNPVRVVGLSGQVTALTAGPTHTCAATSVGDVQCWGSNSNGELGNGSTLPNTSITPVTVPGLSGMVTALQAGYLYTCALSSSGAVQCWGYNYNGQLGNGSTSYISPAVTVAGLSGSATALTAGGQHSCALISTGVVQCWGINTSSELGNGNTMNSSTPVTVKGLTELASAVAAGFSHTCAVSITGAVQCWGLNNSGQLGNGGTINSATPVTVIGPAVTR
ncbi:MAG: hypothetical protein HY273_03320 [Gammaproteobacteria bacterium]|nr:hypothetical protein [Gammaproteobacteria bacterium]